jgi:hypothetical protein
MAGGISATYVDATIFTVAGDYTKEFLLNRRVKANIQTADDPESAVKSASYDSANDETTVNIWDSVLDANLVEVWFGNIAYPALPRRIEKGSFVEYFSADPDGNSLHFELIVSRNRDMSSPVIDKFSSDDQTNWYYDDGAGFDNQIPAGGVPSGSQPCSVEYAWENSEIKQRVRYYMRWRSYDGTSYSDPFFDVRIF